MSTKKTQSESAQRRELKPNEVPLSTLDVGDVFALNEDGTLYQLIDMKYIGDHRDNVWAYADAETGDYEGLIRDGACPAHFSEPVIPNGSEM